MNTQQIISTLWMEMRQAINATYANDKSDDAQCLCDYAGNICGSDSLSALLGRETANERQHRSGRPLVPGFSVSTAAKLILMNNAREGAELKKMPTATTFLVFRRTAAEATVIGFLIRERLPEGWRDAVACFDYAKLMGSRAPER